MLMAHFFAYCGDLLLTEQGCWGTAPMRKFDTKWHYENGWAKLDELFVWTFHLYTPVEQRRIDAERLACA